MTVTQPCVSVGTGTLSPDMRVFYQYGMVLGLSDFVQEQTHNLGLEYHHERALHGYGTVYGLHVTSTTPPDAPEDVTVTVEPGMAVDQWGREVTVPSAQCARLGAWLTAQDQASAGTVETHLGDSGELVIYVVAAYAECPDDLVPLPGQPCSTSAQLQVPSRLRDAWDIDFRWAPPAMPAWDAVRQLSQLLNSVQIVTGAGLSPGGDEEAIIKAVLAIPSSGTPSGSPPGPVTYQLPADGAAAAFDRILTVWVTRVRPQLAPDLTAPDPACDPAVLLSTVTFTVQTPFSAENPVIMSYSDPDDTGRPYLLHTELIQEMRLGGSAQAASVQEAVTLSSTVDPAGVPTLSAWFHLGQPVSLPATIHVAGENSQFGDFTTAAATAPPGPAGSPRFSELWTLSAPTGSPPGQGFTVTDGDQLSATFPATDVLVGDSGATLAAVAAGQSFLNTTSTGDVTAYTTARMPNPASIPFVTVSYFPRYNGSQGFELWFHPQPTLSQSVVVTELSVQVVDDTDGVVATIQTPTQISSNVWLIPGQFSGYLRLLFSTDGTTVTVGTQSPTTMSLTEWIARSGVRYVGWEEQDQTIVAFARIDRLGIGFTVD